MNFCLSRGWMIVILLFLILMPDTKAIAQQVEISSSLNPVGSGARAVGMGSAFIGVADDATAASWNPAGLVQLEKPEVSAVYSYFNRKQQYDSSSHPEVKSKSSMGADGLNFASVAFPFVLLNRNMTISVNYQRLFELNKDINFRLLRDTDGETSHQEIEFAQDGYLYALSPALAVQITPALYVGVTVNIWDDFFGDNGWETDFSLRESGLEDGFPLETIAIQKEKVSFEGVNANFGFLWTVYHSFLHSFMIGGVVKTSFDADLRKESIFFASQDAPTIGLHNESLSTDTEDLTMEMPLSYGLGISYRHSNNWTIALDVYRTDWSNFIIKDSDGNKKNPLNGRPVIEGKLKDTTQVRFGTEYLFIREKSIIPLRFGLFYDPEPALESPDDFYGFSFGTGYARGRIAFDAAYQYRTGKNVTGDIPRVEHSSADIDQHIFMLSAIFYFK